MIVGFLLKIVVGLALLGIALFESLGPIVLRGQLDGRAHDVADLAALTIREGRGAERAESLAREVAGDRLKAFTIGADGVVRVRLEQEADSVFVKRYVKQLRSWYHVRVEATASTQ